MSMYAIDTLEFAKRLRTAGLSQEQSEAIAEAHGQAFREAAEHTLATKQDLANHPTTVEIKQLLEPYATKQDITELRSELKQDTAEVRSELKQDIAEVRAELKQDIAEVRSELKQDIKSLELRMTSRLGAMIVAATGIMLAAMRFM
ncbi:CCDC90 family protein [Halomonas dongshanensis]|uniref:CCDC90 family protein n=1 Tax=Halomonas dongshanensis TaxID=2890835 RepID=A0ABT2EHI0_9GAMM|nr:CCDC90 family protein [Halomonas dongshanensis]MCS2611056.1 CCDC90 family protein [Halomonas dongshanensis]